MSSKNLTSNQSEKKNLTLLGVYLNVVIMVAFVSLLLAVNSVRAFFSALKLAISMTRTPPQTSVRGNVFIVNWVTMPCHEMSKMILPGKDNPQSY